MSATTVAPLQTAELRDFQKAWATKDETRMLTRRRRQYAIRTDRRTPSEKVYERIRQRLVVWFGMAGSLLFLAVFIGEDMFSADFNWLSTAVSEHAAWMDSNHDVRGGGRYVRHI